MEICLVKKATFICSETHFIEATADDVIGRCRRRRVLALWAMSLPPPESLTWTEKISNVYVNTANAKSDLIEICSMFRDKIN